VATGRIGLFVTGGLSESLFTLADLLASNSGAARIPDCKKTAFTTTIVLTAIAVSIAAASTGRRLNAVQA
jgi:hypothetical protein